MRAQVSSRQRARSPFVVLQRLSVLLMTHGYSRRDVLEVEPVFAPAVWAAGPPIELTGV
jgi:hypothetical protein